MKDKSLILILKDCLEKEFKEFVDEGRVQHLLMLLDIIETHMTRMKNIVEQKQGGTVWDLPEIQNNISEYCVRFNIDYSNAQEYYRQYKELKQRPECNRNKRGN